MRRPLLVLLLAGLTSCGGSESPTGFDDGEFDPDPAPTVASVTALTSPGEVVAGESVTIQVRVDDSAGTPMSGVSVTFSASADGAASPASATTAGGGIASTTWTVGTQAGSQTLTASASGRSGAATATVVAAAASALTATSGNTQAGTFGQALPNPIVATAADSFGNPVSGVSVTFTPSDGGVASPATVTTDDSGNAATSWTLGASGASQTLEAVAEGLSVTFDATASATAAASFDLDIRIVGSIASSVQSALDSAEARWEEVITGDLVPQLVNLAAGECDLGHPAINETVDDMVIYAAVQAIDGESNTLAAAGPCVVREGTTFPAFGTMEIDEADIQLMLDEGTLGSTILHEMGHVLGIGSLWEDIGVLANKGTANPTYTGAKGIAEYQALGGANAAVPVENTGGEGTADSHWRTSVFGRELMTGFSAAPPNPMSTITIGSLNDLGYVVDLTKADSYSIPVSAPSRSAATGVRRDRVELPRFLVAPGGELTPIRR